MNTAFVETALLLTMLVCVATIPGCDERTGEQAVPMGDQDFEKRWKAWEQLPSHQKKEWLAEPEFNWNDDYVKLCFGSISELAFEAQEAWAIPGYEFLEDGELESIGQAERKLLLGSAMIDCRPFRLTKSLKETIQNAPNLKWLRVGKEFSVKDLDWLVGLRELRGLDLSKVDLDGLDLAVLNNFRNLIWLELNIETEIHWGLPNLPDLEVLRASGKGFDDRHFSELSKFRELRCLYVASTSITDRGVEKIAEHCPKLTLLDLGWCEISSGAIEPIATLRGLKYLYLNHTPLEVEVDGFHYQTVPVLQLQLPNCHIRIGER